MKKKKQKKEFSKVLLIQESILIWITTLAFVFLAFLCVEKGYLGSLPYVTTLVGVIWGAYGASQAFYYNKSKAENTVNGIKYETTMAEILSSTTASEEPTKDYYFSNGNNYQI